MQVMGAWLLLVAVATVFTLGLQVIFEHLRGRAK